MERAATSFNGHPPLGVNATTHQMAIDRVIQICFNGHPPLGVNATDPDGEIWRGHNRKSFNGHPPLGVNATEENFSNPAFNPTVSMGTHPWG